MVLIRFMIEGLVNIFNQPLMCFEFSFSRMRASETNHRDSWRHLL